jgi:hypothetical protein
MFDYVKYISVGVFFPATYLTLRGFMKGTLTNMYGIHGPYSDDPVLPVEFLGVTGVLVSFPLFIYYLSKR